MADVVWPGCRFCRHFREKSGTCEAFPKGIPLEVASGEVPHLAPLRGQLDKVVFTEK